MTIGNEIVFYDIASGPPVRTFAPNPWKTRYALNFKTVTYKTQAVDMPDIASVREQLGVPANRTLPNGSPYHTLPLIHDRTTNQFIGDTFEIAVTNHGPTIPPQVMNQLFQPFSRGSAKPGQQGLGLGLYIAAAIARAHEGTLGVVSADGVTTFTFRMPANAA